MDFHGKFLHTFNYQFYIQHLPNLQNEKKIGNFYHPLSLSLLAGFKQQEKKWTTTTNKHYKMLIFINCFPERYLAPYETSMIEPFAKMVNG